MGIISEMLSYPFMVRALIGGLLVSLCASLLGVSLVLKRYSMIGDGLSHVSFGSLSIALAAGWSPLKVSIPVVVLAAFFLLRITEHGKVKSDAAIAMISASALAIGIIVTSLTTGMTTDVSSYMFGSILAMSREDVQFAAVLSMVVLGLYLFCYNKVFAVTFDESFAKATGVNVSLYNVLIAVLTAITDRDWNADDGRDADLQSDYFPGSDLHAGVQELPGGGHRIGDSVADLFLWRNGDVLHVLNTGGRERCCGGSGSVSALFADTERDSCYCSQIGCFL